MGTLYWSIVALALGGCIGSFLNVVIYRGARGLSVCDPARSFCPACRKPIAWYDNIPVISYLWLRARCRQCGASISLQYPIIELATAFVFLMTYDVFCVGRLRVGIGAAPVDAVMLVAHWALFAGLIVLTVMDLEAYMVDIRVTWLLALVGVVAHTIWTPTGSDQWIRPGTAQSAWALAAAGGLGIGVWWALRRQAVPPEEQEPPTSMETAPLSPTGGKNWRWLWLVIPIGLVLAYLVGMLNHPDGVVPTRSIDLYGHEGPAARTWSFELFGAATRVLGGLALLFVGLTLAASCPQAEVDSQIVAAIESEAPDARRMALWEMMLLAPAIVLSTAAVLVLANHAEARATLQRLLAWSVWGDWRPVLGLSTGLAGWVIAGAIAWGARIIFTLTFGKEALGMGDVHIMAAAGAVAGWPVALMGFFLGAMLALVGLIVIHLRRQSRALPYGPWLGLGFFLAAMFQDGIFEYLGIRWLF